MSKEYLKNWRRNHAEVANLLNEINEVTPFSDHSSSEEYSQCFSESPVSQNLSEASLLNENESMLDQSLESHQFDDLDDIDILSNLSFSSDEEVIELAQEEENSPENIGKDLRQWAVNHYITHKGLRELLSILRSNGHECLPKDPRTLLSSYSHDIQITAKAGGDYAYFGIVSCLNNYFREKETIKKNVIDILVNIDGLPLFKSTNKQLWPILLKIEESDPQVAALFLGVTKPESASEFLSDFLEEYNQLLSDGFSWGSNSFSINLKAFVCDAPARQFIKGIKSHTGFFGCERCIVKGEKYHGMVFTKLNEPKRTNDLFLQCYYKDHQIQRSPLIDFNINCVEKFSLDYMHLICLGVMRRILIFMKEGRPCKAKLSHAQILHISERLCSLNGNLPSDFARQPRSLMEIKRWKAVEFRQFLLYTGPVVLKGIVTNEVYTHFLALSVAVTIMLQKEKIDEQNLVDYAHDLLVYFVSKSGFLYNKNFVSYNVHTLIHLKDDIDFFHEPLHDLSGFPFENHLQILKKYVRSGKNPLAQVINRVNLAQTGNLVHNRKSRKAFIKANNKDAWFVLNDSTIIKVIEFQGEDQMVCDVFPKRNLLSFFQEPCDSKLIGIFYVKTNQRNKRRLISIDNIANKLVSMDYKYGVVTFPLIE